MISNKGLILKVKALSGLTWHQSRLAVRAVIEATSQTILEGQGVNFWGLGTFYVKLRKGRVITHRRFGRPIPEVTRQRAAWRLKFKPAQRMVKRLETDFTPANPKSQANQFRKND